MYFFNQCILYCKIYFYPFLLIFMFYGHQSSNYLMFAFKEQQQRENKIYSNKAEGDVKRTRHPEARSVGASQRFYRSIQIARLFSDLGRPMLSPTCLYSLRAGLHPVKVHFMARPSIRTHKWYKRQETTRHTS